MRKQECGGLTAFSLGHSAFVSAAASKKVGRIGLWTNSAFWSSGPCRGCSPHFTVMNTDASTANQTLFSRACTDAWKDATRSSGPATASSGTQRPFGRLGVPGPKGVDHAHGVPGPWPWFFPPRLAARCQGSPVVFPLHARKRRASDRVRRLLRAARRWS